jgi:EamA domain-containing membrane protein RarD
MFAIDPLAIVAIVAGLLSFAFLLVGLAFVRKRRALGATLGLLVATLLLSLAALFATFAVATQGYRALTREQIAVLATSSTSMPTS